MRKKICLIMTVLLTLIVAFSAIPVSAAVVWSENWDGYAAGTNAHGINGWKGWGDNPAVGAFVSNLVAQSPTNSIEIVGLSDLVHEYAIDSGVWVLRAYQYIPSNFVGQTYFILLNNYNDAGTSLNWSTQVVFDSFSNLVINDGPAGGILPFFRDTWVEIRVEIDLDTDTQAFFYDNVLLFAGTWTGGMSGSGTTSIEAIDLYANYASPVYYDDITLDLVSGIDCDDGNACTVDRFDPITGQCVNTPLDCDDQDPNTTDTCVDGECVHTPITPPGPGTEVGGDIYPVNKVLLVLPAILATVALLSCTILVLRHRSIKS